MPAHPSQADEGAKAFWLNCLPCHGDKGQGLTDEFRAVYPTEDQNCWNSGCHGRKPYRNGWTLPTTVPRLIGDKALSNFSDAAALHTFISVSMPFQAPGRLDDKTYWELTAFLLRQNGYWSGVGTLDQTNAASVKIAGVNPSTPTPFGATQAADSFSIPPALAVMSGIILVVLFIVGIFAIRKRT